jgi:hypothetical protein
MDFMVDSSPRVDQLVRRVNLNWFVGNAMKKWHIKKDFPLYKGNKK